MAQLANNQPRKERKRLREPNQANTANNNPNKRRKLNSDTTSNSIEEKESEIIFKVKIKIDGKDKFFDCYKNKKGQCSICYVPDTNLVTISPRCKHCAKYCLQCISKSIESTITQKGFPQFKCDYSACNTKYEASSIFPLLSTRNLQIVDKLLLHKSLSNNTEFRWCKSSKGCGNGQLVGNGQDLHGYYCCDACGEQHCFQHEIVWHSGFTCDEYEKEMKANPNFATNEVLSSFTKKCPNCSSLIAKLEGCDVMRCCQYGTHGCSTNKSRFGECDHGGKQFCGQLFCWKCLGKINVTKRNAYQRLCKPNCAYVVLN